MKLKKPSKSITATTDTIEIIGFGNKNVDSGTGALFDAFLPALESWTPPAPPPKYEDEDNWDEHEEYEDEGY